VTPYYADESVTLYHGDCRDVTAWLEADVLVTDPPYGVAYESGWSSLADSRVKNKPASTTRIRNDETVEVRDAALVMWGNRPALVFGTWRAARPGSTRQRLIWHKRNTNPGMGSGPWYSADEEVYVLGGGFTGPKAQSVIPTDEYRASGSGQPATIGHPTPKPLRLMEHLIERCPPGVIADPFAGSGSTLLAARNLGRRSIGVEEEERYCELIARRLSQDVLDFGGAA
jgi:DNA modification methylase